MTEQVSLSKEQKNKLLSFTLKALEGFCPSPTLFAIVTEPLISFSTKDIGNKLNYLLIIVFQ